MLSLVATREKKKVVIVIVVDQLTDFTSVKINETARDPASSIIFKKKKNEAHS